MSLVVDFAVAEEKSDRFPLSRKIDENIYFAAIHPFADEWNKLINQSRLAPAPVNFWLRCIDRKVSHIISAMTFASNISCITPYTS
ncbi:hypothetical protein EON63_01640 [archaeon]|nr:MAG: hypothetical protein EON63_01640 [archaeon]